MEIPLPNGDLVDATDAARLLGKTRSTIDQYRHRGIKLANGQRFHLTPAGRDPRGYLLYRLSDLAIIRNATVQRGTSPAATIAA